MSAVATSEQEACDRFYIKNGPCCAGCDWWDRINSGAGECRRSSPVSGAERMSMLGMRSASLAVGPGHPITHRSHHCGDFKDEFDWRALPAHYLRKIGWEPTTPKDHK